MANDQASNRRTRRNTPRRPAGTSTVKELLLAKYGPRGYGRVLDKMRKATS